MTSVEPQLSYYRWVMLAGVSLLYFCFALVHFSTASLATIIIEDLNLSLSEMGTIMGAWPMAYIFLSIPAGLLLDRFGIRFMLLFGISVIGLSAFLRACATSHLEMFFAVLIFGLGSPFISVGVPKLIREWFSYEQRGLALGICTATIAVGSILGLTLSHQLLLVFDGSWRSTLNFYAMVSGISVCVWSLIIFHPLCKFHGFGKSEESLAELWSGCKQLLRSSSIQAVLILSIGIFFFIHATINWLPKLITQLNDGMSASEAAYWASLPVVIAIISAAVVPRYANNDRETLILSLLFIVASVACLLLTNGASIVVLVMALCILGIVRGALPPVSSLLMMHMPGVTQKNIGGSTGLFFAFGQIGGVMGPVTFGFLADYSGGFDVPLYFLAGFCIVLVVLSLNVGRVKQDKAE
jgi:MFS transporter, CP family, cyanate transporter